MSGMEIQNMENICTRLSSLEEVNVLAPPTFEKKHVQKHGLTTRQTTHAQNLRRIVCAAPP